MRYTWTTLGGKRYTGVVREVDSNVLIVDCDDDVRRAVEADEETLNAIRAAEAEVENVEV
jgi:hypothetical protein